MAIPLPKRFRRTLALPAILFAICLATYLRELLSQCFRSSASSTNISVEVNTGEVTVTITTTLLYPESTHEPQSEPTVTTPPPLQRHRYRKDGLLEVNPDGQHPIYELIERAEQEWQSKLKRASSSLDEAVEEYERRYKRPPPKGFDDWWFYADKHNVQLPDEYDQIYHSLEPFWGIKPADLRALQAEWEEHEDTFTIGKKDGTITLLSTTITKESNYHVTLLNNAYQFINLLKPVQHFLPPFRAIFSPHDNPNLHTDWELKKSALDAAASGSYININDPPPENLDGWISACAPDSPAQRQADADPKAPTFSSSRATSDPKRPKTFIHDHRLSMDPCLHPSLLRQHGQFLSHGEGPIAHSVMYPQFSNCATLLHHDILPATPINWVEDVLPRKDDPEWENKLDDRLLWRGSNTGIAYTDSTPWRDAHRTRFVVWAHEREGNATVLPPGTPPGERVGPGVDISRARYNPAILDVSFAGKPLSCSDSVCEVLAETFDWQRLQGSKEAGQYKYVLDVDDHGWSSRFKRLITSNSLVFKSTIYSEWYQDRIAPWVHYVPVQMDLSDLYDSLLFFRGDLNGEGAHEDMARNIAKAGREWSKTFWREEDMTAYMFRLFLEYARLMSTDRKAMSYTEWEGSAIW